MRTPVETSEAEIQVPERAAERYVGQRVTVARAPGLLPQVLGCRLESLAHLPPLALDPIAALLFRRASQRIVYWL